MLARHELSSGLHLVQCSSGMATCETDEIENANAMLHYTVNTPVSIFTTFSESSIVLFTFSVNAKKDSTHTHTHSLTLAYWAIIDQVYTKINLSYIQVTEQNLNSDNA